MTQYIILTTNDLNNLRATIKVCPTCGKNHDEKDCITSKALSAAISRTTDPAY